ncbi:MAG: GyrI-like domain-containing protein [Gammaproteobacteria bacterium]|jgi:predicted transcriptional regulator YdeE
MDIQEKTVTAKKIVGIKTTTSKANESHVDTAKIPALWQTFFSEDIEQQIPLATEHGTIFGVYTGYDSDHRGKYQVIVGNEVHSVGSLPDDMAAIEIPAGRYLVFSQRGEVPAIIYSMWEYIWNYFSSEVPYQRLFTTDFELYRKDDTSRVDIYIAVKNG